MVLIAYMFITGLLLADDAPKKLSKTAQTFIRRSTQDEIRRLDSLIKLEEERIKRGLGRPGLELEVGKMRDEMDSLKSGKTLVVPFFGLLGDVPPGQAGRFYPQSDESWLEVGQIINAEEMLVIPVLMADIRVGAGGATAVIGAGSKPEPRRLVPIWIKGRSTDGLQIGQKVNLDETYEVISKKRFGSGKNSRLLQVFERVEIKAPAEARE